jgi:hypothetical protein
MAACNIEEHIKLYTQGNKSSNVMCKLSCLTMINSKNGFCFRLFSTLSSNTKSRKEACLTLILDLNNEVRIAKLRACHGSEDF